ncbi:MAG: HAMP domain-containing histidine kinase [Planctomycetes bacterium]|nr:HAMP domain-containing histidine kinase [Planctomycetota bacterium]
MQVPVRLSQESLFGFLTSTRLPVVSSIAAIIRWISLGLAIVGLGWSLFCLLAYDRPWWSPELPWSGMLPALASSPVFFAAWWQWRHARLHRAAILLFVGLFTLSILANYPRGAFSPAWYLHPFLSLLATIALGVLPGLGLTLVAVVAMLLPALRTGLPVSAAPDVWVHVTSLASLTLASALAGTIVNRLVFLALTHAEAQRRALRYREKLLRHALRVETVGDLAGMVCHQLRNAHQILLGHVTLAESAGEEERGRRLQLIEHTLAETRPLLDQLMQMAHPDEGSTAHSDMTAIANEFCDQARLLLSDGIELRREIADGPLFVLLNPRGLSHALWNMVINARQALDGRGAITLRCGGDAAVVWIEVADDGPGMPADVRDRIFDPYFTTKPVGQGTGLGLTAVARFVRSSSGEIEVASEPGRGTRFRMSFPRAGSVESRAG